MVVSNIGKGMKVMKKAIDQLFGLKYSTYFEVKLSNKM